MKSLIRPYQYKIPVKSDCGVEKALLVISGKWKPAILSVLLKTSQRLKDMQEGLPEAPKRALTQQLKEMINDGLIQKQDFNEYPKRTEYSITPLGMQLSGVFEALKTFGDKIQ
ncbi:winged helix-turn-helix transcriptional regulator [Pontibacter pamirensis]|uniref:winged helix-turn-helix transcriptional regulator n=1 Tax=Pontibacter pamirensis TaxID=2562824 RepID=UPI0013897B37|nr:helix-turn-helix domain-containing protein [Pontibacter pamirensis]